MTTTTTIKVENTSRGISAEVVNGILPPSAGSERFADSHPELSESQLIDLVVSDLLRIYSSVPDFTPVVRVKRDRSGSRILTPIGVTRSGMLVR